MIFGCEPKNQNFGFLPSTMADTSKPLFQDNNPVGTLPAQSSRGGSWIQDLSEPLNAYFRSLENQRNVKMQRKTKIGSKQKSEVCIVSRKHENNKNTNKPNKQ